MNKKKNIIACFVILIGIVFPLTICFTFPNTTCFLISLITQTFPNSSHLSRIRNDLLAQDTFIDTLIKHEETTLGLFKEKGNKTFVKKYIHRTSTSIFDMNAFHDYWEVWVRTDVVGGIPLTSFLIRLGLIKDTNAENFFSSQCDSNICKSTLKIIVSVYNKMFDWGVFKPIRLNITESDETSSISRKRITVAEWNELVEKMHQQETGKTFMKFKAN